MDITPSQQPFIQDINAGWLGNKISSLAMLRLDVLHEEISGNKWYKLKENIKKCKRQSKDTILSFGGGYSNHLSATAAMAKSCNLKSIGVVRGTYDTLTPTLEQCISNGMKLHFVTNEEYRNKQEDVILNQLSIQYNNPYIIPEGGANHEGRVGAEEISEHITSDFTHIALSVGTGTTLIGVLNATNTTVLGYAPMKGGAYLADEIRAFSKKERAESYTVFDKWHFGGFGKVNTTLIDFMNEFYDETNIPLDRVYTAKMMYGVKEQIISGVFDRGTKLLCIHTGGLQGNSSLLDKLRY